MEPLITKKDLAARWQVTTAAIDLWIREGRLAPCRNVPGDIRFNPDYIAGLEGVKMDKFSPLERRRMQRENEELKARLSKAESALARAQAVITEAIYCGDREEAK